MKASQSLELGGVEQIWANLDTFTAEVRDKITKRAMKAATDPLLREMKKLVPRDFDVLRDAIEVKITSSGQKGNRIRAYIGIRRGIKVPTKIFKRGKRKGNVLVAIPTKYAHLIEFGHDIVRGGKVVGRVKPKSFIRAAWDEYGAEVALYTFADIMQAGIAAIVIRDAIANSK